MQPSSLKGGGYGLQSHFTFSKAAVDHAVLKEPVVIYQESNLQSAQVAQLNPGDEIKLGAIRKKGKVQWVSITTTDGRKGYLLGTSRVFRTIKVRLNQEDTSVLAEPSINSHIKFNIGKDEKFYILDTLDGWMKIQNLSGNQGFVDSRVLVKKIAAVGKDVARRNMTYGALWCIGGGIVTCLSYSAVANAGGTYIITWGAIIFGAIQFLQGVSQYMESSSDG